MRLFSKFCRAVMLLLVAFMMAACVDTSKSLSPENQQLAWQKHQQALKQLNTFTASGSLSYIADKSKYYGRFFINQISDEQYQLKLTTPVGTSLFLLTVTPNLAELTDREGNIYRDKNVEQLMKKLTGIDIPFKPLHSWFKGLSDNPAQDRLDSQGRLLTTILNQDNQRWHIAVNRYNRYTLAKQVIDLPTSIELVNKQTVAKITINSWNIK